MKNFNLIILILGSIFLYSPAYSAWKHSKSQESADQHPSLVAHEHTKSAVKAAPDPDPAKPKTDLTPIIPATPKPKIQTQFYGAHTDLASQKHTLTKQHKEQKKLKQQLATLSKADPSYLQASQKYQQIVKQEYSTLIKLKQANALQRSQIKLRTQDLTAYQVELLRNIQNALFLVSAIQQSGLIDLAMKSMKSSIKKLKQKQADQTLDDDEKKALQSEISQKQITLSHLQIQRDSKVEINRLKKELQQAIDFASKRAAELDEKIQQLIKLKISTENIKVVSEELEELNTAIDQAKAFLESESDWVAHPFEIESSAPQINTLDFKYKGFAD